MSRIRWCSNRVFSGDMEVEEAVVAVVVTLLSSNNDRVAELTAAIMVELAATEN